MHSTLFTVFGIPIRSYGLMLVVGFALGLWRAVRVARHRGLDPERIYDLALISLLSGVVGARLLYIAINPDTTLRQFFSLWDGGLSFHGGIFLAFLAAYIYTRRAGMPFLQCTDLLAPSVAIGYAFTRIGCFLNGCCHGVPTDLPWGVVFSDHGVLTPPSHPTQLYGFAASLLIFALLTRLERLRRAPGFVFISYLGLYSIYRFLLEFLRFGEVWFAGLTQAQWLSIAVLLISTVLVLTVYRRPVKKT